MTIRLKQKFYFLQFIDTFIYKLQYVGSVKYDGIIVGQQMKKI